jgi:surface antigen
MAINNKPASTYAKPHTMSGKNVDVKDSVVKKGNTVEAIKISLGSQVFKSQNDEVKSDGIKQRGHGAATKGYTSRGPMA